MFPKFPLVLAVYAVSLGVVGDLVSQRVAEPYMDEIFHIPQARRYCAGNFTEWDSKITTLPGLYVFSFGVLDPVFKVSAALGLNIVTEDSRHEATLLNLCSTKMLRSVNLGFSIINVILLYTITSHLHGLKVNDWYDYKLNQYIHLSQESYSDTLGIWSSLNISLCPVLYFFSFLYYTDQVSTAMVFLTLCLQMSGQPWLSAFSGLLSVLCRQTNIVWVFLCGALSAGDILVTEVRCHQAATKKPPTISLTTSGQLRELVIGTWDISRTWKLVRVLGLVILKCGGYLVVGAAFLVFVRLNDGVVVGDRSAHVVTTHLAQILYFAAFFTALTLPFAVKNIPEFIAFIKRNILMAALSALVILGIIHFSTLAHPYLLADNRHFTFYIWRRVIMRHEAIKYLGCPVYMFGLYHIGQSMAKSDLIFKLVLPLCVVINIVPQLLLEFRYFIIPYLLVRAQIKPNCWKSLAIESVMMISVNFITLYAFLFMPFKWTSEPDSWQRFMW